MAGNLSRLRLVACWCVAHYIFAYKCIRRWLMLDSSPLYPKWYPRWPITHHGKIMRRSYVVVLKIAQNRLKSAHKDKVFQFMSVRNYGAVTSPAVLCTVEVLLRMYYCFTVHTDSMVLSWSQRMSYLCRTQRGANRASSVHRSGRKYQHLRLEEA